MGNVCNEREGVRFRTPSRYFCPHRVNTRLNGIKGNKKNFREKAEFTKNRTHFTSFYEYWKKVGTGLAI